MLDDIIGTYGERLVIAVIGLGIAFAVLIVALWLMRRRGGPAPFLKGGRNRQPRLQVLDATAVDARRRLVLVRRDNVEHLIMIGGPTDIVIESGIGAIPIVTDITAAQHTAIDNHAAPKALPDAPPVLTNPEPARPAPYVGELDVPAAAPSKAPQPVAQPAPKPVVAVKAEARETDAITSVKQDVVQAPTPSVKQEQPQKSQPPAHAKPSHSPLQTSAMRAGTPSATPSVTAATVAPVVAAVTLATQPVAAASIAREPVSISGTQQSVTNQQVDDFFDAARGRVLPDLATNETISVAETKLQQASLDDSFSAELRDDFESFLNAEIEKNAADHFDISIDGTGPRSSQKPPITGANPQNDTQKEMARIFGEMSVKRDQ
jgi:flagellar biogenesis protein FliO